MTSNILNWRVVISFRLARVNFFVLGSKINFHARYIITGSLDGESRRWIGRTGDSVVVQTDMLDGTGSCCCSSNDDTSSDSEGSRSSEDDEDEEEGDQEEDEELDSMNGSNGSGGRQRSRITRCWLFVKKYYQQSFQRRIKALVEHKYFQQALLGAILINTLSMGIEYHNQVWKVSSFSL